jgi:type I restriction enzyme, S subunit
MTDSAPSDSLVTGISNLRNLPKNWAWRRLDDLCEGIFDCHHSTPELTTTGPYLVRTQDVITSVFVTDAAAHVSEETYRERTKRAVPRRGDLLYSREGAYHGISAEVPSGVEACLGQRMVLIRPRGELADFRFLRFWLNSPVMASHVRGFRAGSAAERLNLTTIRGLPILIPPLCEQGSIADILSALDDKIVVNDRIAQSGRDLALSHFREAIGLAGGDDVGLSAVAESITRGVAPSYTEDESQLRVLNQKCVRGGRVSLGLSRWTLANKVSAIKLLHANDVLVNSTGVGTLRRVARWTRHDSCTVDSHISIVRFDAAKIDPVCAGFAMLEAEPEIEALGEGSTGQTELSRARLSALKIVVPSGEQAVELRPKLDALETRCDSAFKESAALAGLRDSLLPKLMSGEIRVRDAEKVVEDVA